jgi:hypothetical protein
MKAHRVDRVVPLSAITSRQKGLWFIFHEYSLISPHLPPAYEPRKIGDGRQGSCVTFSQAH